MSVERSERAAKALDAPSALVAATALRAELTGDLGELGELGPAPTEARSVSDLLVLRAHAAGGNEAAAVALKIGVERLAMPGLGFAVS